MLTPQQLQQFRSSASSGGVSSNTPLSGDDQYNKWKSSLQQSAQAPTGSSNPIGDFAKSLVSAPATMLARPFQAAQSAGELIGAGQSQGAIQQASSQKQETTQHLIDLYHQKKALGQDTSHIEQTLQAIQATPDAATAGLTDQANFKPSAGGIVAAAPQNAGDVGKDVGRGIQTAAFGLGPVAGGAAFMGGSAIEQGKDPLHIALDTVLGAAGGKILGLVGKPIFNAAGKVVGKIDDKFLNGLVGKGTQAIQDFAAAHDILPEGVSNAINNGADAINGATDKASQAVSDITSPYIQGAKDTATGIAGKVENSIKGKTTEDILATPESDLYKLSTAERNKYFSAKQEELANTHNANIDAINKQATETETKVKADSQAQVAAREEQNTALERDVSKASIKEAQGLKPQVVKAMGENSQIYRDLIDRELAPVKDVKVSHEDIKSYLDAKYGDTPGKSDEIAKVLGLKGDTTVSNPDEIQMNAPKEKTTTIGDIYDNIKSLRQDIGSAGKKGARVFTPEEMKTNDAISALSGYLKDEKGIDFKEANKFWSNYAPLRDKIIKAVQPFTPEGSEKATFNTFTKGIRKAVEGTDPHNEAFISSVEDLLGTKIGNEDTRAAIASLTQSQKEAVLEKAEADMRLAEEKIATQEKIALEKAAGNADKEALVKQQSEIDRQGKMREYLRKGIKWGVGLLVGGEVVRHAPL